MDSANVFKGLLPITKDVYASSNDSFSRIRNMLNKKHDSNFVAQSENEASKDPEGFLNKSKNLSIKGAKGIAL